MEESYEVNAECVSCSFKGHVEIRKGKKTLRERRRTRRIKSHEQMDSDN